MKSCSSSITLGLNKMTYMTRKKMGSKRSDSELFSIKNLKILLTKNEDECLAGFIRLNDESNRKSYSLDDWQATKLNTGDSFLLRSLKNGLELSYKRRRNYLHFVQKKLRGNANNLLKQLALNSGKQNDLQELVKVLQNIEGELDGLPSLACTYASDIPSIEQLLKIGFEVVLSFENFSETRNGLGMGLKLELKSFTGLEKALREDLEKMANASSLNYYKKINLAMAVKAWLDTPNEFSEDVLPGTLKTMPTPTEFEASKNEAMRDGLRMRIL